VQQNVGVIARVPFDEGALTGRVALDTSFPEKDFRARYFRGERKRQVVKRVEKLQQFIGEEVSDLPELALRFCLHHEAVGTVIPGMRTVEHVHANCRVSDGRMVSAGLLRSLREHRWEKNFYH
jgi:aryl-alcohol dehydrogenase-like predicted oxidoreductase